MGEVPSLVGVPDHHADEWSAWRTVIDTVEAAVAEFGFREVATPSVERTALYRAKSGDQLLKQAYTFEDRGGREVTLRPEKKPTLARMVQNREDLTEPVKWFDTSKRWRYRNVQNGSDREFVRTDVDVFGVESVRAEAELLACGLRAYEKLGVEDRVEFRISDRRLLRGVLDGVEAQTEEEVIETLRHRRHLSGSELRESLENCGLAAPRAEKVVELTETSGPIRDVLPAIEEIVPNDEETTVAVDRMYRLADHLETHSVAERCLLHPSTVGRLPWSTGFVVEASSSDTDHRCLLAGGRYDRLVGQFGDRDVPAVGLSLDYSATRELLQQAGEWPDESTPDVYVVSSPDSDGHTDLVVATRLRKGGLDVVTDVVGRSVDEQLRRASEQSARFAVVVENTGTETVTLHDEQRETTDTVRREELAATIRARCGGQND